MHEKWTVLDWHWEIKRKLEQDKTGWNYWVKVLGGVGRVGVVWNSK